METKICQQCMENKSIDFFRFKKDKNNKYYRYSYCKECEKELNQKYKITRKERDKRYRKTHREEINAKARQKRKTKIIEKTKEQKEKEKEYMNNWREKNRDKIKIYQQRDYLRRKEKPQSKLKNQIRKETLRAFKTKGLIKNAHTEEIVGMSLEKLYLYLLQTYKSNYGVEWDGIEKVHIDHIIPISQTSTKQEIIKLCHYSNLQLLKAKDNLQKYNKLNWELQK